MATPSTLVIQKDRIARIVLSERSVMVQPIVTAGPLARRVRFLMTRRARLQIVFREISVRLGPVGERVIRREHSTRRVA